jgi:hypothetical protein
MRRAAALIALALAGGSLFAAAEAAPGVEPGTVVAVLDTGVSAAPELTGRVLPGRDLVDGDANAADVSGHGTAVAVAAARACGGCRILPVRVLSDDGAAPWSRVAAGIVWAVDNGARVLNLSIAGPDGSRALREAVAYALARDVVVVAAAGNAGDARPQYPAAYRGVVAVAATGVDGRLQEWSSRGAWVDLAAPGCAVLPRARAAASWACGTSFAAPRAAGAAGAIRGRSADAPATAVAARLARVVGGVGTAGALHVSGLAAAGSTLRATAAGAARGGRVHWYRCAPGGGAHDCVAVSTGASYRVRASDRGSELVARAVTDPFAGLWLAASPRLAVD